MRANPQHSPNNLGSVPVALSPVRSLGIAVAGASCSGKTTLAQAVADELGATLLRIDDYYRALDHLTYAERCDVNFDHPDAIDENQLVLDLRRLLAGQSILGPRYDFTRHTRASEGRVIEPTEVVIVEGLFALAYPEVVSLCETRVFVHASEEICMARRLERDTTERGRTPGEVISRFHGHVAPMYREHVSPTQAMANVHVSGERALGESLDAVLSAVRATPALR